MKNLIYYPNFESSDSNWLKFALIYLESFSPIIPYTGEKYLSDLYLKLQNKTDLLQLVRPRLGQGERATRKAIEYVSSVIQNPYAYMNEFGSANIVRDWRNAEKQTYTLFGEKYIGEWEYFCKTQKLCTESDLGMSTSKSLGELYMTFLAQEVAYENEASPITDKKHLDALSIAIRTKNVSQDNKIEVAKSIIKRQIPFDFENT